MTPEPAAKDLAPAVSKTWTGFAILEAKFEQMEFLNGNSGESIIQLNNHGGNWTFANSDRRLAVTLRGESEHHITAEALRWLADRLDEAR